MRSAVFWLVSFLLVAGTLAVVVASATVSWLYPAHVQQAGPPKAQTAQTAQTTQDAPPAEGSPEHLAMEAVRQSLSHAPSPVRAARLPGPADRPLQILVWADYLRGSSRARGLYQAEVTGDEVTALTGPLAPEGGYGPPGILPLDEKDRSVSLSAFQGQSLLLVAPRRPEAVLVDMMIALQEQFGPLGLNVVLLIDARSPDWSPAARKLGFAGPVWRMKGRLEDVPVPSKGEFLGAAGLLVDRRGLAVASLAALDPNRYGLRGTPTSEIARKVLEAYGLIPPTP